MEGPRPVRDDELAGLTTLLSDVFGFGPRYSPEYLLAGARRPVMRQGASVIVADGRPVSHIFTLYADYSMYGCPVKTASVGCVATHADHRGRGLAGAILTERLAHALSEGARLMIVSGDRSLYRRHHCVPAGLAYLAKLRGDLLPPPADLTLRRVALEEWPLLAALQQQEPARFLRPADVAPSLTWWWDVQDPHLWLISRGETPLAYAALSSPWGRPDTEFRWISEYAGSRAALLEAVPLLLEAEHTAELHFAALAQDAELRHRFHRLGLPVEQLTVSGTIRLLDLPGLMQDLAPYVAQRLPAADVSRLSFAQEEDLCTFRLGEEEMTLDLSEAARIVCGAPDAPEVSGDLGRVLARLYPLPTIAPGLNYV